MRLSVDLQSRAKAVPDSDACVVVIDDDPDFLSSLGRLLRSVGLHARLFTSVADFLASERPDAPTCLVLDVRLAGAERTRLSARSRRRRASAFRSCSSRVMAIFRCPCRR